MGQLETGHGIKPLAAPVTPHGSENSETNASIRCVTEVLFRFGEHLSVVEPSKDRPAEDPQGGRDKNAQRSEDEAHSTLRTFRFSIVSDNGTKPGKVQASFPSERALDGSVVSRIVDELLARERYHNPTNIEAFIDNLEFSEHLVDLGAVVGVIEQARRHDQERHDLERAVGVLGLALVESGREISPVVVKTLQIGNTRQREIALRALAVSKTMDAELAAACVPLAKDPDLRFSVAQLLRNGSPSAAPIARAVLSRLPEMMGQQLGFVGAEFPNAAEALNIWCRANRDFSMVITGLTDSDSGVLACSIEALSREGAPLLRCLGHVLRALQCESRIVVGEALSALAALGPDAARFKPRISEATLREQDFTMARGLELLARLSPNDQMVFGLLAEQIEYCLNEISADTFAGHDNKEVADVIGVAAMASCGLARMSDAQPAALALLEKLCLHPHPKLRERCVLTLVHAPRFEPIEPLLTRLVDDSPDLAPAAIALASRFSSEKDIWLYNLEKKLLERSAQASVIELTEIRRLLRVLNSVRGGRRNKL